VFGHLLGPSSFDSPKGPLARKQVFLAITLGGIDFILTSTIAPIAYLGSWAFVTSIIVARFMVDPCPFLFEALVRVNNNTFPFQQHLKEACDLLPCLAWMCLPPFEEFIGQQMVHIQDSILERLHHHSLFKMISNKIVEVHHAQILSCLCFQVSIWFIARLIFPTF
jgi:hypothetical protein